MNNKKKYFLTIFILCIACFFLWYDTKDLMDFSLKNPFILSNQPESTNKLGSENKVGSISKAISTKNDIEGQITSSPIHSPLLNPTEYIEGHVNTEGLENITPKSEENNNANKQNPIGLRIPKILEYSKIIARIESCIIENLLSESIEGLQILKTQDEFVPLKNQIENLENKIFNLENHSSKKIFPYDHILYSWMSSFITISISNKEEYKLIKERLLEDFNSFKSDFYTDSIKIIMESK